jgi:hypothetical protein
MVPFQPDRFSRLARQTNQRQRQLLARRQVFQLGRSWRSISSYRRPLTQLAMTSTLTHSGLLGARRRFVVAGNFRKDTRG